MRLFYCFRIGTGQPVVLSATKGLLCIMYQTPHFWGGGVMAKLPCFDNGFVVLCSGGNRYLKGDVRSEGGIWKQVVGLSGKIGTGPN